MNKKLFIPTYKRNKDVDLSTNFSLIHSSGTRQFSHCSPVSEQNIFVLICSQSLIMQGFLFFSCCVCLVYSTCQHHQFSSCVLEHLSNNKSRSFSLPVSHSRETLSGVTNLLLTRHHRSSVSRES